MHCNPFLSRGTSTISFLPLVMVFGQLCVCAGSTLGAVEVNHRPKAIARVDEHVGAVTAQAWLLMEIFLTDPLHFNILFNRYIVVLFLKDNFVSCVSIAAACLIILKLAVINTYCVTSVIMKENQ